MSQQAALHDFAAKIICDKLQSLATETALRAATLAPSETAIPPNFPCYAMGRSHADLACARRRDERTIRDWMSGRAKLPWLVPEILQITDMRRDEFSDPRAAAG